MLSHARLIGFLATLTVSLLLLVAPVYSGSETLIQVNGTRVVLVLAVPVLIAIAPLAFRRLKIPAAIAMFAFSVIGGFSIGLFYIPSTVLLFWPERHTSG